MRTLHYLPLLSISVLASFMNVRSRADTNADNSGNNAHDTGNAAAMTPEDQSNAVSDVKTTRMIRRAITRDSSLSTDAHNIKIITTKDHTVYLRGPVASSDECDKAVSIAKAHSGGAPVMNQLSVTSK